MASEKRQPDSTRASIPALLRVPDAGTWLASIVHVDKDGIAVQLSRSVDEVKSWLDLSDNIGIGFTVPKTQHKVSVNAEIKSIELMVPQGSTMRLELAEALPKSVLRGISRYFRQAQLRSAARSESNDPLYSALNQSTSDNSRRDVPASDTADDIAAAEAHALRAVPPQSVPPITKRATPPPAPQHPTTPAQSDRWTTITPTVRTDTEQPESSSSKFDMDGRILAFLIGMPALVILLVAIVMLTMPEPGSGDQAASTLESRASAPAKLEAGQTLRDCAICPLMVVMPAIAGGSTPTYAIGATEVTQLEFSAFARRSGHIAEGCQTYGSDGWRFESDKSWIDPGFRQFPDHPVTCISWFDASAYVAWLSRETGQSYRLPSVTEWRHADGQRTVEVATACRQSNVADLTASRIYPDLAHLDCDDGHLHTAPVETFAPNRHGLYDLQGNVFEWLTDCAGAVADGADPQTCEQRRLLGGSWFSAPEALEPEFLNRQPPELRVSTVGVRVVRAL